MICMSRRSARSAVAVQLASRRGPRTRPRPSWARSAAGCSARWSTCRSPIRPPGPASRRRRCRSSRRRRHARGRPRARSTPPLTAKCLREIADATAARHLVLHDVAHSTHATLWPGATSSQRRHRSAMQIGHGERAARREAAAGGGSSRLGTVPGIDSSRAWRPRAAVDARDRARSGPAYRDGADRRRARSTVASSTTLPAYITTTRCAGLGDDAQVVGDQHDRHAEVGPSAPASAPGSAPGW